VVLAFLPFLSFSTLVPDSIGDPGDLWDPVSLLFTRRRGTAPFGFASFDFTPLGQAGQAPAVPYSRNDNSRGR